MVELMFIIPGTPKPKQSARFRIAKNKADKQFVTSYQKSEIKDEQVNIKSLVISQLPADFRPLSGAVVINRIKFVFPPLASFNKGEKQAIFNGEELKKTTKPDLDNLKKLLLDAFQGVVYLNDSQIWEIRRVQKVYGNKPRIEIILTGEK